MNNKKGRKAVRLKRKKKFPDEIMEVAYLYDVWGWGGPAKVWGCSHSYSCKARGGDCWFVVSCEIDQHDIKKTLLFAVDERGDTLDWGELPGSLDGILSHEIAMQEFVRLQTIALSELNEAQRERRAQKPKSLEREPISFAAPRSALPKAGPRNLPTVGFALMNNFASYQPMPRCNHNFSIRRPATYAERPKFPKASQMNPSAPGAPWGYVYQHVSRCLICGSESPLQPTLKPFEES